jgi:hypothetical protein
MLAGRSEPPFGFPPRTAIDASDAASVINSFDGVELAPEMRTHASSDQRVHSLSIGERTDLRADYDAFTRAA